MKGKNDEKFRYNHWKAEDFQGTSKQMSSHNFAKYICYKQYTKEMLSDIHFFQI